MKKSFLIVLTIVALLFLVVGCAQTAEPEPDAEEMMEEPAEEMMEEPAEEMMEEPAEEMMDKTVGMMTDAGYLDVTPEEAKMLIDTMPDLMIIDVSPKYDEGHLPGAINYYVGDGSLDDAIPDLDMSKPYLVYCHVDSASISGSVKLVDAGFTPVYRLIGNYAAWVDAGYPTEK
ncbi:rhodanese-like domain-containing protein [Clostridia bacterium]|nr:rhodanese-like domain-containing protein [Clostridia bacterium]